MRPEGEKVSNQGEKKKGKGSGLEKGIGDFTAVVSWGDGTTDIASVSGGNGSFTVTDDHTYAEKGSYPITVQISDTVTGGSTSASTTATVTDASLTLTGGFQLGDPMTDAQSSFTVATFTDANPDAPQSDYTAKIDWGDGSSPSVGQVENAVDGVYSIEATHAYSLPMSQVGPLTFTVTVTLTDADGANASTTSTVVVGKLAAGVPVTMSELQFMDANTYAKASDFVAQGETGVALINWGDGTSSLGTVTGGPGNGSGAQPFTITGVHTYAQDSYDQPNGQYAITMTVTDVDGNVLTGTQYVSVVRPSMAGQEDNVEGQPGAALSNVQVAEFTVPDATDGQSEFSATIAWGDGNSSSGVIQEVTPGLFEVLGTHTYVTQSYYPITVSVEQGWDAEQLALIVSTLGVIGNLPPVVLESVTFHGGYPVKIDLGKNAGETPNPQWLNVPAYTNNILTSQKLVNQAPYAYIRGKTLNVDAKFDPMWRNYTPNIEFQAVVFSGGKKIYTIPATKAITYNRGAYSIEDQSPNGLNAQFPNTVADYKNLEIVWQASVNGGKIWANVGKSSNEVYLIYNKPAEGTDEYFYQTVVAYGSAVATGPNKPSAILDGIWKNFSAQTAKRADGQPLYYYKPWANKDKNGKFIPIDPKLGDLLNKQNAQCTASAQLLYYAIQVQGLPQTQPKAGGIGVVQMYKIEPDPKLAPIVKRQPTVENFLVGPQAWKFGKQTNPGAPYPWTDGVNSLFWNNGMPGLTKNALGYNFKKGAPVTYEGITGQNNKSPLATFANHYVVQINGVFYDPSYGLIYKTLADMQADAIAGFYNATLLSLTKQMLIRKPGDALQIQQVKVNSDTLEP